MSYSYFSSTPNIVPSSQELDKCSLNRGVLVKKETAIIFLTNPTSWWPLPLCTLVRIVFPMQCLSALHALICSKMYLQELLEVISASKPMSSLCIFNYGSTAQPGWGRQQSLVVKHAGSQIRLHSFKSFCRLQNFGQIVTMLCASVSPTIKNYDSIYLPGLPLRIKWINASKALGTVTHTELALNKCQLLLGGCGSFKYTHLRFQWKVQGTFLYIFSVTPTVRSEVIWNSPERALTFSTSSLIKASE